MRLFTSLFGPALAFAVVALAACGGSTPPAATAGAAPGAAASPGAAPAAIGTPAPAPGPTSVSDKECPQDYWIDDMESGAPNQIIVQGGRRGYWYTFVDSQGSTISPPAKQKFIMSAGGHNNSAFAARFLGKISATGDPVYAGMGFSFTNPKGPYDASAYTGVSFWAKLGPGSQKTVRLKVPDVNTDPDGHVCTECFNDFGADLNITETWTKYTIPFAKMSQMEGWGAPLKPSIDKSKLFGMQWQFNNPGQSYDLWVDEVSFTGCP